MTATSLTITVVLWTRSQSTPPPDSYLDAPFHIKSALVIGAVITSVLVIVNVLDFGLPESTTRLGIVLVTLTELTIYTAVTWSIGSRQMARLISLILVTSTTIGLTLSTFL